MTSEIECRRRRNARARSSVAGVGSHEIRFVIFTCEPLALWRNLETLSIPGGTALLTAKEYCHER